MSKTSRQISGKAERAAKSAKRTARVAVSKSGTAAKTVKVSATKTAKSAAKGVGSGRYKVVSRTAHRSPIAASKPAQTQRRRRPPTPVELAAREGVILHDKDGVVIADDADVLRIAEAVTEHRKGLMDNLAR